jgi:hypothetical protein
MLNLLKKFSRHGYIMSTVSELRILAKTLNVRGYTTAKKADLITLIEKHQGKPSPLATEAEVAKAPEVKVKVKAEDVKVKAEDVKVEKPKRTNDWNSYLADYRKEHGGTLRAAMAGAKESYAKHKESKKAQAPVEDS